MCFDLFHSRMYGKYFPKILSIAGACNLLFGYTPWTLPKVSYQALYEHVQGVQPKNYPYPGIKIVWIRRNSTIW